MTPAWFFNSLAPNDRARQPQVEKFFKSDVLHDRPNAVVREGIQNSLDAPVEPGVPVHVRIAIGSIPASAISEFTPGLFPHLDAVRTKLEHVPDQHEDVRFLAFEDFNTTGLTGDPDQWQPLENVQNPFYNFFRGEGVTDKSGNARGRHGVGKLVFSVLASRAHAMFGLTVTESGPPLLMGTSTLQLHHCGETYFHPDGWFGVRKSLSAGSLCVPIRDEKFIQQFIELFGLARDRLPGLSIVVPWLPATFDYNAIVGAVVQGFFWPVLKGELNVEIVSSGATTNITAETILECAAALPEEHRGDALATLQLAHWALSLPAEQHITMPRLEAAPRWHDVELAPETLRSIQTRLDADQPAAIRVPMQIKHKDRSLHQTHFDVYLQTGRNCDEANVLFVREGLIISGMRPRRCSGHRALVVVEEGPLGTFLGDAENPAHTEWLKDNVKSAYSNWAACIDYVVNSVPGILSLLSQKQTEADPSLLIDLFSLPSRSEAPRKPNRGPKKKGAGETERPEIDVTPKPRRFTLQKRSSGFVISKGEEGATLPATLAIQVGYGVRRGSPFKKYRLADFRLDRRPIEIEFSGCTVTEIEGNRMLIAVESPDFSLAVTGFDTNRDLHVDAKARDPESENGEAA